MASRSRAACAVYLECLEPHILEGKLHDAPVQLIQQYVQHLADEGLYSSIEASIIQLPVDRLDLHQVKCDTLSQTRRFFRLSQSVASSNCGTALFVCIIVRS